VKVEEHPPDLPSLEEDLVWKMAGMEALVAAMV
jgi:hypothetical protein